MKRQDSNPLSATTPFPAVFAPLIAMGLFPRVPAASGQEVRNTPRRPKTQRDLEAIEAACRKRIRKSQRE